MAQCDGCDELENEVERLEADRERLDWLEHNLYAPGPQEGGWQVYQITPGDPDSAFQIQRQLWMFHPPTTLREAIEHAMELEKADANDRVSTGLVASENGEADAE